MTVAEAEQISQHLLPADATWEPRNSVTARTGFKWTTLCRKEAVEEDHTDFAVVLTSRESQAGKTGEWKCLTVYIT
jgi:hypothetical protein